MSDKSARDIFGTPPKPRKPKKPRPAWLKPRPKAGQIRVDTCEVCGGKTTSFTNYFCAGCHFAGWWGRWETLRRAAADDSVPAGQLEDAREAEQLPRAAEPAGEPEMKDRAPELVAGSVEHEGATGGSELVTPIPPAPTYESTTPSGIEIRFFEENKELKVKRHYEVRLGNAISARGGHEIPGTETEWRTVPSVSTVIDKFKDSGGLIVWAQKLGAKATLELLNRGLMSIHSDEEQAYGLMRQYGLLTDDEKKKGGKKGQSAHDALETWAKTRELPDPAFFPPEEIGYIRGLRMFLEVMERAEAEVVASERVVASAKHGFAGRFDIELLTHKPVQIVKRWMPKRGPQWATLKPGLYVPDLKTSAGVYKHQHFPQLEGYELGRVECGYEPSLARGVIHVHPGDPTSDKQPDHPYYEFVKSTAKPSAFLAMLALYREMEEI